MCVLACEMHIDNDPGGRDQGASETFAAQRSGGLGGPDLKRCGRPELRADRFVSIGMRTVVLLLLLAGLLPAFPWAHFQVVDDWRFDGEKLRRSISTASLAAATRCMVICQVFARQKNSLMR